MKRRIALTEMAIGPGATVRLKKEAAPRLADRMARWEVLSLDEQAGTAHVIDVDDEDDSRVVNLADLERVKGGVEVVTGYAYVDDGPDPVTDDAGEEWETEFEAEFRDDADDGSLFDDPIALQMEEDEEDEEDCDAQ